MTTRIPNLYRTTLQYASFCSYILKPDLDRAVEIVRGLDSTTVVDCVIEIEGQTHRVSLTAATDDDGDVHVHAYLARSEYLEGYPLPDPKGNLGLLQDTLARFHEMSANLGFNGTYEALKSDLPNGGIVRELSSVTTELHGMKLSLTGAEVQITGKGFRKITWSQLKDKIQGDIHTARKLGTISSEYMEEGVRMIDAGVRQIILSDSAQ